MRKYKAVIIDFKKISRRISCAFLTVVILLVILFISAQKADFVAENTDEIIREENHFSEEEKSVMDFLDGILEVVLGFNPFDYKSVIEGSSPVFASASKSGLAKMAENHKNNIESEENSVTEKSEQIIIEIPKENQAPIKKVDLAQKVSGELKVAIGNETAYGINIQEMLSSPPEFNIGDKKPKILITHTHATEGYAPKGAEVYDVTASDRTEDRENNVVAVGKTMKEVFDSYGIETLHDEILHDVPSFNGSYAHSLKTVNEYMEKYPSIEIVFDIHRDSIVYADKMKAKAVTEINGESVAQLMFVVGTDENGLEHPNWRENMKSALWFQNIIAKKYPKLMRHINLRKERFNGHTCSSAMIIEVGTSGNSLDEAKRGIELAAHCIAQELALAEKEK